jgi:hypothetical protein
MVINMGKKEVRNVVKFIKAKFNIDLTTAPCFDCPIEKRGYECTNPRECELLSQWMENLKGR